MVPGSDDASRLRGKRLSDLYQDRQPGIDENKRQAAWRNAFREGFHEGRRQARESSQRDSG
jgi:flagellar biosynthesis/type III secretory pathway protein FliH